MSELKECRAAFEAWASDENKSPRAIEKDDTGDCYMLMQTHSAWMAWKASWKAQANADRVDALKLRLHQVDSAAHKLAARLTMIATAKTLRGNDLIRREDAMELVVQWRREWDAAVAASKTTAAPSDQEKP